MNYFIFSIMFLIWIISIQLTVYIFINRKTIFLPGFLGLNISLAIYSGFYALELIASNLQNMKLFTSIEHIGIFSIPAFWVIMAVRYTDRDKIIKKSFYIKLFIIPVCLMLANFTNEYHHLFYKEYKYNLIYSLHIADLTPGIFYYLGIIYTNLYFLVGNMLYLNNYMKKSNLYKKRSFIILLISCIPWIGYWIYMLRIMPVKIDIVPISLVTLSLLYLYALFNSSIFGTISLARRIIFNDLTDAIILLDKDNLLIEVNRKAEELFHIKNNNIIGREFNYIFKDYKKLLQHVNENGNNLFNLEIEINEQIHYFQGKIDLVKSNNNEGKIIILSDNTEQIELNKKLEYYATTDTLTGVYNKNYFYEIAVDKIKECFKLNKPVSLIIFDFDNFKNINDSYGHLAGDVVLKKSLEVCKSVLEEKYYIGRYGGEEFVILLNDTTFEKAVEIAENIREAIEKVNIVYENSTINITSSFGVFSCYTEKNLKYLLKNADEALYEAKKSGRNRVCGSSDLVV